jgi:hypothetical protein
MTHSHSSPHHSPTALPFTDHEWRSLRDADKVAGRNIVVLMTSVFFLGLLGYSIVAWIAMT